MTDPRYLAEAKKFLDLPAEQGSLALPGGLWADHAAHQIRYLNLRRTAYAATDPDKLGPPLRAIWDGDDHDEDAFLTVFRHFDNATVVRGLIGKAPETAWIIDYPIFERIYYNLVAGFDVFGNVTHQIATRLYMDHLRMQSENLLLAFVPEPAREPLRDSWYLDATDEFHQSVVNQPQSAGHGTQVRFTTTRYIEELFAQLRVRTPAAAGPSDVLNRCDAPPCTRKASSSLERTAESTLQKLAGVTGSWVEYLPEVSWVRVYDEANPDEARLYTLVHNRAHTNVASMFGEKDRLQPELDGITLIAGNLGSYPNFLFDLGKNDVPKFTRSLMRVRSSAQFEKVAARYGVRRTDPRFWSLFDWIHTDFHRREPSEAGLIDLNRYENH